MDQDHDGAPHQDPLAWARAETIAFTKRKLKRYGLLALANAIAVALILKGMPGYSLWPVLGIPLIISFACLFTPTLYFAAMLVGELLDRRRHPPNSGNLSSSR
jgi:hypothetical protein